MDDDGPVYGAEKRAMKNPTSADTRRLLLFGLLALLMLSPALALDLNYWIEPDASGNPAKIWVKVPYIPANGSTTIYVWKEAGHAPNPYSVFDFYDGFGNFGGQTLSNGFINLNGGSSYCSKATQTGLPSPYYMDNWEGQTDWDCEEYRIITDADGISMLKIQPTRADQGHHMDAYSDDLSTLGSPDNYVVFGRCATSLGAYAYLGVYDGTTFTQAVTLPSGADGTHTTLQDVNAQLPSISSTTWHLSFYVTDSSAIAGEEIAYCEWIGLRKYAPQEPTATITDYGEYYAITISNPNSTDLNDFQVFFSAQDVNVTSTTESLAVSTTPPRGVAVSLDYTPKDQNQLALDPENNITSITVDYNAIISKTNVTVTYYRAYDGDTNTTLVEGNTDVNYITFSRTYTAVGDYNTCVSVEAVDDSNQTYEDTACDVVHIDEYPQGLSISWGPKISFPSEAIEFNGSATDNGTLSYSWDFGDGNTGSGQTTTHAYGSAGTYTVTMTVTDDVGLSKSVTESVPVYAAPILSIPSAPICAIACVDINHDARLSISSEWNVPDKVISTSAARACSQVPIAGDYNVFASVILSDEQNHTRELNLAGSISISPRVYNITLKDITGADYNASKVDSITGKMYGTESYTVYGSWSGPTTTITVSSMVCDDTQLLVQDTISRSTVTWTRHQYIDPDVSNISLYSPYGDTELFYTITLKNTIGNPYQGIIHMLRYIGGSWTTVDEIATNPDGTASFFLTPSTLYQIRITDLNGTEIYRTYYTTDPNNRTLTITITVQAAEVNTTWDHVGSVEYILPDDGQQIELNKVTGVTLSYSVHDFNNALDYYGLKIYRGSTLVYDKNVVGSPSGGDLVYNTSQAGTYRLIAWYKQAGHPEVTLTRTVVLFYNMGLAQFNPAELFHSPVIYLFVAAMVSIAAMGFAVSLGAGGAGVAVVGIAVLAAFILPSAHVMLGTIPLHYVFALVVIVALAVAVVLRLYV